MLLDKVINSKINIKVIKGINNIDFVEVDYIINEGDILVSLRVRRKVI